jgi:hypothetical protein
VGRTGAEVHVIAVRDHSAVVVPVPYHGAVGHHVLVFVVVPVIVAVAMIVVVPIIVAVAMTILLTVRMVVTAAGVVHVIMGVAVPVIIGMVVIVVAVRVPVHRPVGMTVLVRMVVAFDLRFAASAAACRAHSFLPGPPRGPCPGRGRYAISISFTRISSPCVTCS